MVVKWLLFKEANLSSTQETLSNRDRCRIAQISLSDGPYESIGVSFFVNIFHGLLEKGIKLVWSSEKRPARPCKIDLTDSEGAFIFCNGALYRDIGHTIFGS